MEKKKYLDLKDFLRKNKTIPENEFTHTALGIPPDSFPGSYCINDDEQKLFYNLYNKHVFEDGKTAHLTEKHCEMAPILIDLDLRHEQHIKERQYTFDFLKKFILNYVCLLKTYLPNINEDYLKAFVLEKETPNFNSGKNVVKDGIHIMFPYIITEPKIQYLLRYLTINNPVILELFESINNINSADEVFDLCVIERNNWQMYGSCKPNNQTYKLTNIFHIKDNTIIECENDFSQLQLVKLLSIRNITSKYVINSAENADKINDDYENIPRAQQNKKKKRLTNKRKKSPLKKNTLECDEDLQFVKEVIKLLNERRADVYDLWIRLGWCLHNIDYRLLDAWEKFSKKSYKYVNDECEKEWRSMDNDGLGLGTLYMWCREDNLVKFNEISKTNLRKCMMDSLSLEANDIAKVVYHMFKHEFVCCSSRKNVWYQFKNHRWIEIDESIELRKRLSNEVKNEYMELRKKILDKSQQASMNGNQSEHKISEQDGDTVGKIIKKLSNTSFKKNVMSECSEMFHSFRFEEKLDSNLNIIGFENGIYDLDTLKFRDGLPEDFVSYTTKINYLDYDSEEEEDDENINNVKQFVSEVLPKKAVREYVLTLLGSFLTGRNLNEKFHIWTGCGGNGKSKLIELFENAFGNYCCKLPVSLLTQSRGRAEGATPALFATKGKRFACLQEPSKDEEINVGLMKELTGGDKIIARGLHKDPVEFKPQFKMVLTCNTLPNVSSDDRGTWRRISVVDFPSKFVDNPDPNEKYEFKIDDELDDKLKMWPEAFMFVLINYYRKYKTTGLKEPPEVKRHTEEYKSESDAFSSFIGEKLLEETSMSKGVELDDVYIVYQAWFRQAYGANNKCPSRKDVRVNMTKKFGNPKTSKLIWYGLSFREKNIIMEDDFDSS
jgi:P4 family phage/plasmid primase-like protien